MGCPSLGFKPIVARLNGIALRIFKTESPALDSRLRSCLLGAAVVGMRFAGLFVALSIDLEKCQACEIVLDGFFPQGVAFAAAFAFRIARLNPGVLAFVPASVACKEARFEAGERFAERIGAAFWQVRNFGEAFFVSYELVFIGRIGSLVVGVCFVGFVV